jgi:iron only hydrogenase large subunit-like protein
MIQQAGINLPALKKSEFDEPLGESTGAAPIFGVTGGVMEAALRTAYEVVTGKALANLEFRAVRGFEGIKEAAVELDGLQVKVAVAYGLANTHTLLTEIAQGKREYHFIEIMSCPGGCIGGGGQPYPQGVLEALDKDLYQKRADGLYGIDEKKIVRKSHENPQIKKIYSEFLGEPLGKKSHALLHTHYHLKTPHGITSCVDKTVSIS